MPQPGGWAFRAASALATGTTSLTISKPTGTVDGDIMLMALSHKSAAYATVPAGWTLVSQAVEPGTGLRGELYWKRAASEGSSYSITGLSDTACGGIVSYSGGLAAGNVVNAAAITTGGTGTATDPITTTEPQTLILTATMGATTSVPLPQIGNTTGFPIGYAGYSRQDYDLLNPNSRLAGSTSLGSDCALAIADGIKIVPGSTVSGARMTSFLTSTVTILAAFLPDTTSTPGTRYYLSEKRPGPPSRNPWALNGDWAYTFDDAAPAQRTLNAFLLSQTKADAGRLYSPTWATNQQGDYDLLLARYLTPPLLAQALTGTIDLCVYPLVKWLSSGGLTQDTVAQLKLHVYTTVGQTQVTRTVLVDNYIDPTNIQTASPGQWRGLTTPQSVAGDITEGDSLVVEIGVRIVSSPTPAPTYPPTEYTELTWVGRGATDNRGNISTFSAGVPFQDATVGSTNATLVPYLLFTDTIAEADPPAAPSNCTPATATPILVVPYSEAVYDVSQSTSNARAVWYVWTPTRTGQAILGTWGSVGLKYVDIYTATDASDYSTFTAVSGFYAGDDNQSLDRSLGGCQVPVVSGTTYYIRVLSVGTNGYNAPSGSPGTRLSVSYRETIQADDVIVPDNNITIWRNGVCINWTPDLSDYRPAGVTIDYTRRPLISRADGLPNTNYRIYTSLFAGGAIEILDIDTLNLDTAEIDFIGDSLELAEEPPILFTGNLSAVHMDQAGQLTIQTFGDGFLFVAGILSGIPAYLNAIPAPGDPWLGYTRGIDGTHADNQPGAPWPFASELQIPTGPTNAWHGGLSEDGTILYHNSGGLYFPVGSDQTVHRYSLATQSPLSDFATIPVSGTAPNPGLKGMCVIPAATGGGLLVCNGDEIVQLSAAGAVVRTFKPVSAFPLTLIDVRMLSSGTQFWAFDNNAATLFRGDLVSGAMTQTVETYQGYGNGNQIAIFTPTSDVVPDPTPERRVIRRLRQAPHLSDEQRRMRHTQFQLDVEAGLGLPSGQGLDPTIYLSWSDDGGHLWSNEYPMTIGQLGQYRKRVIWRRLGITRDRVYRVTMSDPVRWVLLDAYLEILPGNGT